MRRPSIRDLPHDMAQAATGIAERVRKAGARAWLVGGTVRDLALEVPPHDLDLASALEPTQAEALFDPAQSVGKAFGCVVVPWRGCQVQLTTFRADGAYADSRRPDSVRFAKTLEEDSQRRDFTCNALFLDPLEDELADPQGGLEDMHKRVLRAVGEARARFEEDRLRLLRLARFQAKLDFQIDAGTWEGARAASHTLTGVSPERIREELARMFEGPRSAQALLALADLGLLELMFPGLADATAGRSGQDALRWRANQFAAMQRLDLSAGLSVLLDPDPRSNIPDLGVARARAEKWLNSLRLSKVQLQTVLELWNISARLDQPGTRAEWVRLARQPELRVALQIARDRRQYLGMPPSMYVEKLAHVASTWSQAELWPEPWIVSADLEQAGVPRGPLWKMLLVEAETMQLNEALADRPAALEWLAQRATQVAGKTRRSQDPSG